MKPHTLRIANPNDAADLAAIYRPYVLHTTVSFESTPPDAEEVGRRMTLYKGRFPWIVCEADGAISGYAYASPAGQREGYRWAAEASVYVAQDERRCGTGRALYTALSGLLRAQRFRCLLAAISCPNPESERFHETFGFRRQGTLEQIGYKFGQPLSVAYYNLALLPAVENPPKANYFSELDPAVVQAILHNSQ